MAHFRTSIETDASAQAAFDYLSDFSNTRHWDPTVEGARTLTPGPIGEGTRFEVRLARPGGSLRFEYIITRFEPSRRLVLEAQTKLLRSLDTIEIEPLAHGCRVRYDADLRLRGAAYLFDLPVHLAFQISGARSVKANNKSPGSTGGIPATTV